VRTRQLTRRRSSCRVALAQFSRRPVSALKTRREGRSTWCKYLVPPHDRNRCLCTGTNDKPLGENHGIGRASGLNTVGLNGAVGGSSVGIYWLIAGWAAGIDVLLDRSRGPTPSVYDHADRSCHQLGEIADKWGWMTLTFQVALRLSNL
jgi:hypothetical protein